MNAKEIVRQFITSELTGNNGKKPIGDHEPLIETGIIDSLGIMKLLAFMESELSLRISDRDLTPENFESIDAISRLIQNSRT